MIDERILTRYEEMLGHGEVACEPEPGISLAHLRWMLREIRDQEDELKSSRWLGFVQGVLVMMGVTTVTEERNFTRSYFRS